MKAYSQETVAPGDKNRRKVVFATPVLALLGLPAMLFGCGGDDGGDTGGPGAGASPATQTSTVVLAAPFSGRTGLTVLSRGVPTAIGTTGHADVEIANDSPALVSLIDSATNLVVGHFLVNPAAAVQTFDAENMATALLFIALGGYQFPATQRQAALSTISKDPTIAGLSAALTAAINARPTAYATGDSTLFSAIQQALNAVEVKYSSSRSPQGPSSMPAAADRSMLAHEVTQNARRAQQAKAMPLAAPLGVDKYRLRFISGAISANSIINEVELDQSTLAYVFTSATQVETALYFYLVGRTSEALALSSPGSFEHVDPPIPLLGSPVVLSIPTPISATISGAPDNSSDVQQTHLLLAFRPIFGPPLPFYHGIDTQKFSIEIPQWEGALAEMYERAAAGLALKILAEVLGVGGHRWSTDEIKATLARIRTVSPNMPAALLNARRGESLPGAVLPILDAMTADSTSATASIQALMPIFNVDATSENLKLVSAVRSGIAAWRTFGIISDQNFAGPDALDLTTSHRILEQGIGFVDKTDLIVTPSLNKYAPAGSTISISVTGRVTKIYRPDEAYFHYKVVGSTNLRITDNSGNNGLEFDSANSKIDLITNPSTLANVLTVSVEMFSTSTRESLAVGSVDIRRGELQQITIEAGGGVYACSDPLACGVSEYTAFLVPVYPNAVLYTAVLSGFAFAGCNRSVSWAGVKADGGGCDFPVTYHPHSSAGPTNMWAVWVGFGGPIDGGRCMVTVTVVA